MPKIARTAADMISGMTPELRPGLYAFVSTDDPALCASLASKALATFREDEGLSLLLSVDIALDAGLKVDTPMRCITLNVYSSLIGTGLTAAVSKALNENAIPCNMIAAFHHDHVLVPEPSCEMALGVLQALQDSVP